MKLKNDQRKKAPFISHIAIAVADPAPLKKILQLIGFQDCGKEKVEDQGVFTHFIKGASSETQVELLEPCDPQGVVAKFLERKGPGIHHFCIEVTGLKETQKNLRKEGVRFIYDEPRKGAHHKLINFIHPASAGGVLLELSQDDPDGL